MKKIMIKTNMFAIALMAVLFAGSALAKPYVILNNGQRREGAAIRRMSNGDIMLTSEEGSQLTFTADQIRQAFADKPAYFDRAVEALRAGKPDMAVTGLEKVVSDYKGLGWDVRAMPYLAQAYAAREDYGKAERAFDQLFNANPELRNNTDLNVAYANALLQGNKMSKLDELLGRMIADGDQRAAAHAQLMRGNINFEKQDYKAAAKDYLRTVYFFRNIGDVMPEATFKLAEALDKIRDKRAKKWYSTVVANYPGSEYAAQAKSKL